MKKIPLIRPYLPPGTKEKVCEVLDSGYLTEGPVTKQFEDLFRRYVGSQHALAVCNCTVGLEVALRALGIGPGDEVIVPDYTYPATASVVNIVGATVVLVDVERDSMLIDQDAMAAAVTPRTKAIIPVSIFGNPLDYSRLNAFKAKTGITIIEDAACSIGVAFNGQMVGNLADISVFSLHPRKFVTTGEGGVVTTNNPVWAESMNSYKHFGMACSQSPRKGIVFERIGTNYKLSNILSAVGLAQMQRVDELATRRRELAARYEAELVSVPGITLPRAVPGGRHSYQTFCVLVEDRDRVMNRLREQGIEAQIGSYSLHQHPAFQRGARCRWFGSFINSSYDFTHALALPLFHEMTMDEQERVVEVLRAAIAGV
jgi:dTDP-4-amino-4,6-dideoxygalactose transaminase